jgi:glycosyltransferase involved in cell wall biosynthesis
MKINILFKFVEGPYGGGNQFLKALQKQFIKLDIYENDAFNADVILVNSHHYQELDIWNSVIELKKNGKLFIHRIDGPLSLYRGGFDDGSDDVISCFNNLFCEATVFQSNWSRNQCYNRRIKHKPFEATILNASDPDIFYKAQYSIHQKIKLIASSWSKNYNKGIEIYKFIDKNLDFEKYDFTFVGNIDCDFQNIKRILPVDSVTLSTILRNHDICISASKYDPCSNSIIESLSCGLPVIAYNSGGHPEIVQQGGELCTERDELLSLIKKISNNLSFYRNNLPTFSIHDTAVKYQFLCKKLIDDKHKNSKNYEVNKNLFNLKSSKQMIEIYGK